MDQDANGLVLLQQNWTSSVLILLASCQQTCMTYTIAVCAVKNSWWWTEELSETCRVLFQKKFEKLVHLVGFIIRVYHDARSPGRQICPNSINRWSPYITSFVDCPSANLSKCDYGVRGSLIYNAQMAVHAYWTNLKQSSGLRHQQFVEVNCKDFVIILWPSFIHVWGLKEVR